MCIYSYIYIYIYIYIYLRSKFLVFKKIDFYVLQQNGLVI